MFVMQCLPLYFSTALLLLFYTLDFLLSCFVCLFFHREGEKKSSVSLLKPLNAIQLTTHTHTMTLACCLITPFIFLLLSISLLNRVFLLSDFGSVLCCRSFS